MGAQVRFPIGDEIRSGKVIRHKRSLDGTVKGCANANFMMDTITYEVESPDGRSDEYTENVIAKNIYTQCDEAGNPFNLMDGIVDHKTDGHTVDRVDNMFIKHGINKKVRKTTKVWHLCIECKYGPTSWEQLADLKESNSAEVAEYDVSNNLHDAPAFVWWVTYVLKKSSRIIAVIAKMYHKRTHKCGIEVPKSWYECVRLYKENGNTHW
jgi:hypothetical protein